MRRLWIALTFFFMTTVGTFWAAAAPGPLTGLSMFNKPDTSLAFTEMGFELKSLPKNWIYKSRSSNRSSALEKSATVEKSLELGPVSDSTLASLSFRSEKVSPKTHIETYVRQFLRDYNQYGFEVVQLKSFKKAQKPFVVVDLSQKNKQHRSRQIFYHNKDQIIIATCLDEFDSFTETLKTCNQVVDSIAWLE